MISRLIVKHGETDLEKRANCFVSDNLKLPCSFSMEVRSLTVAKFRNCPVLFSSVFSVLYEIQCQAVRPKGSVQAGLRNR